MFWRGSSFKTSFSNGTMNHDTMPRLTLLLVSLLSHLISCNPLSVISGKHDRNTTTLCHSTLTKARGALSGKAEIVVSGKKLIFIAICLGKIWWNVSRRHYHLFMHSETDNRSTYWLLAACRRGWRAIFCGCKVNANVISICFLLLLF